MTTRLQKRIAEAGLMSRRAAEELIRCGRVTVNGHTAVLGDTCEDSDRILVDGRALPQPERKRCFMLHKPRGYVCTLHDEKGRRSVRELLPADVGRIYPVGRLDIMSEGLLLLTNDGDLTRFLTHPSHQVLKVYRISVCSGALEEGISRLRQPFGLDGVPVCAKSVQLISRDADNAVLDITVGAGRNRQIRRMCDLAGLHVKRLIRIAEGPLHLGSLPCGAWRELTDEEIQCLMLS